MYWLIKNINSFIYLFSSALLFLNKKIKLAKKDVKVTCGKKRFIRQAMDMENSVLHFVVQTKKAMESNYKSFKQGSNMIMF